MPIDLNLALTLGSHVQNAYAAYFQANNKPPGAGVYPVPKFTEISKIYADDLTDGIPDYTLFGYMGYSNDSPGNIIIAIRGTEGWLEWLDDFHFGRVNCPFDQAGGDIEEGFSNFYDSLSVGDQPGSESVVNALAARIEAGGIQNVYITGHSLGSALVTTLALDFANQELDVPLTVYTFASPFVGDSTFAKRYNAQVPNTWRIANSQDLVPKLPGPIFGYTQVNTLYSISSSGVTKFDAGCWHAMTTYLHLLDPGDTLGKRSQVPPDCAPG